MRLYTIQSLEVVSLLYQYKIYFPSFDKCYWLNTPQYKEAFEPAYRWMTDQYNKRKNQDFSSAPVWWYTDIKEAISHFKEATTTDVILLKADIPDKLLLFHDFELWSRGPFSNCHLGWLGHLMNEVNDWTGTNYQQIFDRVWDLYQTNPDAMTQTWENIFNVSRSNPPKQLHATTQYIDFYWLEQRKHEGQPLEM